MELKVLNKALEEEGWKIIASDVELIKVGNRYKGLCPFHSEKTPSFTVNQNGLYHCFGCKNKGNAIVFLKNRFGLTKSGAIEYIAKLLNLKLDTRGGETASFTVIQINELASKFYSQQLTTKYREYLDYLKNRGYTDVYIEKYRLGFAPSGDMLFKFLNEREEKFDKQTILESQLVKLHDDKKYRDFFHNRIIWPIYDGSSRIIAFSGRVLDESKSGAKYLNIGNNSLYNKHAVLYGLDRARAEIAEKQCAIIVEGYTDTDILHINGIKNVVATCGTALCKEHIMELITINSGKVLPILLLFDGDSAGIKAVHRVYELLKSLNWLNVISYTDVVLLKDGLDPCDAIKQHGIAKFKEILRSDAVPLCSFILSEFAKRNIYSSEILKERIITGSIELLLNELFSIELVEAFAEEFLLYFPKLKPRIESIRKRRVDLLSRSELDPSKKKRHLWKKLSELHWSEPMIFDILKYIFLETESANEILSRERDVIRKSFVKVPDELTNLRYAMYASKQLNKLVDLFFLLDGELYLSMLNKLKKELLSDDSFNQLLLELSFSSYYGTELDTDREFMKKFFLYRVISLRVKYLNGKLPFIKKNLYSQSLFLQYRKLHKDYSREMKSNYTI